MNISVSSRQLTLRDLMSDASVVMSANARSSRLSGRSTSGSFSSVASRPDGRAFIPARKGVNVVAGPTALPTPASRSSL